MDVYENCPVLKNDRFCLRFVAKEDCRELLKVYSDIKSIPIFNSDNCHGDDFYYQTEKRMMQAIDFWLLSYKKKHFVRWSIIDCLFGEIIGTVELFRREANDDFTDTALLRLDLRSDYEEEEAIVSLLSMLLRPACELFDCCTITTKAIPEAIIRRRALQKTGFQERKNTLKGHDGTPYEYYFVYEKCV